MASTLNVLLKSFTVLVVSIVVGITSIAEPELL
jgi:hypothetical protein